MNLKERGITIGDLLILIIIITSTILIKSFSKDKKTTLNYSNQEQVSYKENYYHKFIYQKQLISDLDYKHKEWSRSIDRKY